MARGPGRPTGDDDGRPDDRKSMIVRAPPALWKELRYLAVELETTSQALLLEAMVDLLKKHGRKVPPPE